MSDNKKQSLVIFTSRDGKVAVDTRFDGETLWLSLDQMASLFERDKSTISRHIKNAFEEGELERVATVAKFATVQIEREREVERQVEYFNLDVIISVGYRVKSLRGTQFRQWVTQRLNEYYALDDERLKQGDNAFDKDYFRELLERVRSIRANERRIWQQITATGFVYRRIATKGVVARISGFSVHKRRKEGHERCRDLYY